MALSLVLVAACGGHKHSPTTAAAGGCPPNISAAVAKQYPDAKQTSCESEHEDGKDIFEVKLSTGAEIELSPDGTITAMEEVVPTSALPDAVTKAFATKYPGAQAEKAEKISHPGKSASFEIKFAGKEATFSEAGELVEEEGADKAEDGDHADKD
jgi:hypothetical protein